MAQSGFHGAIWYILGTGRFYDHAECQPTEYEGQFSNFKSDVKRVGNEYTLGHLCILSTFLLSF